MEVEIGEIINRNGRPVEVVSIRGRALEVEAPNPEKLNPEVLRRIGLLSEVAEEVGV